MHRREYLLTGAVAFAMAGCMGGDDDPDNETTDGDDDLGDGNTTDPDGGADVDPDEDDSSDDDEEDDDDDDEEPAESLSEMAIHHWPFGDRTDSRITDTIGDGDGVASADLETLTGDWYEGHAERCSEEGDGHIDLGYLESITSAVNDRAFSLVATIEPASIEPDHAMTILGAGGGESDWLEFRLSESDGARSGQPMLRIRDDFANTIEVAVTDPIEPGTRSRIAVRLDGRTADDVTFWIDGDEAATEVVEDDELTTVVDPEQSFGLFASNPQSETTIGTRRFFRGTIDNVVFCDAAVPSEAIAVDYETQPWAQ